MLARRTAGLAAIFVAAAVGHAWAAGPAKPKTTVPDGGPSNDAFRRICDDYLNGKWQDLEPALRVGNTPAGLDAEQRGELAAIRKAVGEGRPAWWQPCKDGRGGPFRAVVWGRTLDLTFDPAGKSGMQMNSIGNRSSFTVSWAVADMDNPQHAEHGFSKGDLTDLGLWSTLGMTLCWSQLAPQALAGMTEQGKLRLYRYQDFRGNVTALYYGTPKTRRWGEFLYLLAWNEKYARMPNVNARKAAAALFLAEVLTEPSKYPSLPLPKAAPVEKTEEKLAEHYRNWIERHGWTVAEDIALRKAIQAFAAANDQNVFRTQQVVLPNRLKVSLDPEADAAFRAGRDAWLKAQLEKALGATTRQPK
jgi:hypothetical protein